MITPMDLLARARRPITPPRFYGKYRGKVADNVDPLFLGRIIPIVPAISNIPLTWAMPCTPYAGMQVGLYAIPPIDANVWIEFEAGDPNYPIWVGCFWEEGEVPMEAPPPTMKIFKTESITIIANDLEGEGGLTIEVSPPAVETPISITLDSEGIQVLTEAIFQLDSQETNITSETISVEATDTNITSEVNIEGDVNIVGAEEIEGDVNMIGAVEIEGDVNVVGAVEIEGDMNVLGAVEIEGDVAIAGGAEVVGVLVAPIVNGGVPIVIPA